MEEAGINVLGALPRRGDLVLPERHLGLVQAVEHEDLDKAIVDYANFVEDHIDIAKLVELANSSQLFEYKDQFMEPPAQRIALAKDEAFSFTYPHLLEGWHKLGQRFIRFRLSMTNPQINLLTWFGCPGGIPSYMQQK